MLGLTSPTTIRFSEAQLETLKDRPAFTPLSYFFSSATERIAMPSARVSGRVTECEYHPGIEAE
jgi:hypothetical protein